MIILKIVFMGTPLFGVRVLERLVEKTMSGKCVKMTGKKKKSWKKVAKREDKVYFCKMEKEYLSGRIITY